MENDQRESVEEWRQNAQESVEVQSHQDSERNDVHDRMRLNACPAINHIEMCCFACISPVPPRIPLNPFVSYGIDHPLSSPAVWLTTRCLAVELFSSYCLFWNTWFKLLSGTCYGLSEYMDCL
jgi:hypothetical protein